MTQDELSHCIAAMEAYWPHGVRSWTPQAIEAWESLLLDLDVRPVMAAIQVLATDGDKWPPPPGLLRRRALELTGNLPEADKAWGEVCEQIRQVGSLRGSLLFHDGEATPVECQWSHPLIGQVADRMGWDDLCQSENPMADRAHFLKLWATALERERTVENMPPTARALLASAGVALPNLSAARALEPA